MAHCVPGSGSFVFRLAGPKGYTSLAWKWAVRHGQFQAGQWCQIMTSSCTLYFTLTLLLWLSATLLISRSGPAKKPPTAGA